MCFECNALDFTQFMKNDNICVVLDVVAACKETILFSKTCTVQIVNIRNNNNINYFYLVK